MLPTSPRIKSYLLFLIVAAIWGVAGPVIKFTLAGFSPLVFLTYRFAISAGVALVLLTISGLRLPKNLKVIRIVLLYCFLSTTVSLGFLFFGFEKTTALYGSLISASGPIFIAIAGVWFLSERITRRETVGIAIAFSGTVVTVLGPILKNTDGASGFLGNFLVLVSVAVGVATAVLAKKLLRARVPASTLTHLSFIVGFVTILPLTFLGTTPGGLISQIKTAPLPYHLGVFYMALLSGTLAYWLWHKAQKTIEIGEGALFAYLYSIFAAPLAVFWLKEEITPPFIIGALVIAIGVIIAEYKKKRQ